MFGCEIIRWVRMRIENDPLMLINFCPHAKLNNILRSVSTLKLLSVGMSSFKCKQYLNLHNIVLNHNYLLS